MFCTDKCGAKPDVSSYENMHAAEEKSQWSIFCWISEAWNTEQSSLRGAEDINACAHPGTDTCGTFGTCTRAGNWVWLGIHYQQLCQGAASILANRLKAMLCPPWHNDVFLMERKVQGDLPQLEPDVVFWVVQSHEAQIYDILNMSIWQPKHPTKYRWCH